MNTNVYVVGVGLAKFEKPGRREGWDYPDMARESGTAALGAGIAYDGSSGPTSATAMATRAPDIGRSTSSA